MKKIDLCFDWITVRFDFTDSSRNEFINKIGLGGVTPTYVESGMFGYARTLVYGEMMKLYIEPHTEAMGECLSFSGQACREFEIYGQWENFFKIAHDYNGSFTRIDTAIDLIDDPNITMDRVAKKIKTGCVHSPSFRTGTILSEYLLNEGTKNGETIYFGKRTSVRRLVFYDKLKERLSSGYDFEVLMDSWVRVEFRFKKEESNKLAKLLVNEFESLTDIVLGNLSYHLDFKIKNPKNSRKGDWKTVSWWTDFLDEVDKLKFENKSIESTLAKKKDWLERSVAKTLAETYYDYQNPIDYLKYMLDLVGMKTEDLKITETLALLNNHRIAKGDSLLTHKELRDTLANFQPVYVRTVNMLEGKD